MRWQQSVMIMIALEIKFAVIRTLNHQCTILNFHHEQESNKNHKRTKYTPIAYNYYYDYDYDEPRTLYTMNMGNLLQPKTISALLLTPRLRLAEKSAAQQLPMRSQT